MKLPPMPRAAWLTIVALVLSGAAGAEALTPPAHPLCGAAARDPQSRHCHGRAVVLSVVPSPDDALLMPIASCRDVQHEGLLDVCGFGVPAARARGGVALIGDSHAMHWLPALDAVARRRRLHGAMIALPGCTFSRAVRDYRDGMRERCEQWKGEVLAWLGAHPGVATVVTSSFISEVPPFLVAPGASRRTTEERGFAAMWRGLPPSVRHVFVLRDVPWSPRRTVDCVQAAQAAGTSPACPLPRREVLLRDPQEGAVRRLGVGRYRLVDLTRFMCGERRCFSVVGGVLVHKDTNHLTSAFATTLAPYLARAMVARRAVASRSCDPPRYPPGEGYFTSLTVRRASCRDGRTLMVAHQRCRTKDGPRGRCRRVQRYTCREHRVASAIQFDSRVTCRRGRRRVVFTYTQNL